MIQKATVTCGSFLSSYVPAVLWIPAGGWSTLWGFSIFVPPGGAAADARTAVTEGRRWGVVLAVRAALLYAGTHTAIGSDRHGAGLRAGVAGTRWRRPTHA